MLSFNSFIVMKKYWVVVILVFYSSIGEAMQTCYPTMDASLHFEFKNTTEVNRLAGGSMLELCESNTDLTISKLSPIKELDTVAYIISEQICTSSLANIKSQVLRSGADEKIHLQCILRGRQTRMCNLNAAKSCEYSDINSFVRTKNINLYQFQAILFELAKLSRSDEKKILMNHPKLSKTNIKKLIAAIKPAQVNSNLYSMEFHDYSSYVNKGLISVFISHMDITFSLVYKLVNDGVELGDIFIVVN